MPPQELLTAKQFADEILKRGDFTQGDKTANQEVVAQVMRITRIDDFLRESFADQEVGKAYIKYLEQPLEKMDALSVDSISTFMEDALYNKRWEELELSAKSRELIKTLLGDVVNKEGHERLRVLSPTLQILEKYDLSADQLATVIDILLKITIKFPEDNLDIQAILQLCSNSLSAELFINILKKVYPESQDVHDFFVRIARAVIRLGFEEEADRHSQCKD